jgi:hypothetical protein
MKELEYQKYLVSNYDDTNQVYKENNITRENYQLKHIQGIIDRKDTIIFELLEYIKLLKRL